MFRNNPDYELLLLCSEETKTEQLQISIVDLNEKSGMVVAVSSCGTVSLAAVLCIVQND